MCASATMELSQQTVSSKNNNKKSFLSVSLHCFKCNFVETKRVICCGVAYRAVWLHICSFCVNNLSIWHFFLFFFYFVVEQKPSERNPRSMWVEGGGGREGETRSVATKKRVTALHCNLFSRIKYYALHKVYCTHENKFRPPALLLK